MPSQVNIPKLDTEIRAAGIPIVGVSDTDGTKAGVVITFDPSATTQQQTQAATILTAHDPTIPLGLVDCTTTGIKLIAVVGVSGSGFLPLRYTLFVRDAVGVTTYPTLTLGTNTPNCNNLSGLVPGTVLNLLNYNQRDMMNFPLNQVKLQGIIAPTPIYVNVTIAAAATKYVIGADFQGSIISL